MLQCSSPLAREGCLVGARKRQRGWAARSELQSSRTAYWNVLYLSRRPDHLIYIEEILLLLLCRNCIYTIPARIDHAERLRMFLSWFILTMEIRSTDRRDSYFQLISGNTFETRRPADWVFEQSGKRQQPF